MNDGQQSCLFVTPGEPAGVGPDLLLRLAAASPPPGLVAVADPEALRIRAEVLGLDIELLEYGDERQVVAESGVLPVWPVALPHPDVCGKPNPANSPFLLQALQLAVAACRQGKGTLVTGPLQKSAMVDAAPGFLGHTDYLAGLCDCKTPVMMFVGADIKLALATVHLPLAAVAKAISKQRLLDVLMVLEHGLGRWFEIYQPRIRLLGLNPHAGEQGLLGDEELQIIEPAIIEARRRGINIDGPVAADTAFVDGLASGYDVTLSMYHDQSLPAIKGLAFGKLANVTLGLPFFRASVDHGTALDKAGGGEVKDGGFQTAVQVALSVTTSKNMVGVL